MTTKTYLVEMPGDWTPNKIGEYNCHKCPVYGSCGIKDDDCPLANAKEAVECGYGDEEGFMISSKFDPTQNKPVKLYAVEDK